GLDIQSDHNSTSSDYAMNRVDRLPTFAEQQAERAESLLAFSGLKLLHVRRQLTSLLGLIGRDGIFDEYTKHDITHIDQMLRMLEWLVPNTTKTNLTPSEGLLIVLAIYHHDLGMLVTPAEFAARDE